MSEKPACLTSQQYECLIDLASDSAIKEKFKTKRSLSEFWCQLKDEFKVLSDKAKITLLPFATIYLCESGFSAYVSTKTKYRSCLNLHGGADKSLSRLTSRCRRTESIMSLERRVCSCAELQVFSCYSG